MLNENFVIVGFFVLLAGNLGYIKDTLNGKVKPNRVTFFLWSLAPLIAFFAEIKQGVGLESLMTFGVGFSPLIILIASFFNKKTQWKLGWFDFVCGALSLCGLFLWWITKTGDVAITFSIIADGLAALPTIVKTFRYPETESPLLYFTAAISATLTLLTLKNWTFASYGFPLYILIVTLIIYFLIQFKLGKILSS